jgi:HPt (histidine-containing phosphotransfer) domain-containing protein
MQSNRSAMPSPAESRQERIRNEEEQMLARFGGRRQILVNVIGVFLESYPETMASLRDAVAAHDAAGVEESAHKLKGAICNLAWGKAFDTARDLEHMGREGRSDEVDETFAILEAEMERFEDTLRAIVQS